MRSKIFHPCFSNAACWLPFLLSTLNLPLSTWAQGSAFTYQGRLNDGASPASGIYDLRFTIYDSAALPGTIVGGPLTNSPVAISNGLFTLALDFGTNAFTGPSRWLEIAVRNNGGGAFFTLAPRQPVSPTPYALFAAGANAAGIRGDLPSTNLSGEYGNTIRFVNAANQFAGVGSNLTALNASQLTSGAVPPAALSNAWRIGGNPGTAPGSHFLGTTDNQPLGFRVNGARALRLEPTTNSPNVIGGYTSNSISTGSFGSVIAGGGEIGSPNTIDGSTAGIGGGSGNILATGADWSVIGGGQDHLIANAWRAAVGGGFFNTILDTADQATIGGGFTNTVFSGAHSSVIAGGGLNAVRSDAPFSSIGGGNANTNGGDFSTIPGGQRNEALGDFSFAAGRRAKADHRGAFIWADSQDTDFASSAVDQVAFRCAGGSFFSSGKGGGNQNVFWVPGSGSWSFSSDRNLKENVTPIDAREILEKVSRLPVANWNYRGYPQRHIGPMAQDFHSLFPLNESETSLNSADLHGVTLAAIQGLNQKVEAQRAELQQKQDEIADLKRTVSELGELIRTMNQKLDKVAH